MALFDNILVQTCLRVPKDVVVCVISSSTFVPQRDMGSLHITVCCACVRVLACLRSAFIPDMLYPNKSARHPLMITTHHQHSMSPSWSTLFSPIPLEDYSLLPPALPAWLSSTSHIDRTNIKDCFFLCQFTDKEEKKYHKTSSLCQVHLSFQV